MSQQALVQAEKMAAVGRLAAGGYTATVEVIRGDAVRTINTTGTVKPVLSVSVGSFVSGPITDLFVDSAYGAARRVFEAACTEQVDFLILAGDVLDAKRTGPRGKHHGFRRWRWWRWRYATGTAAAAAGGRK